MGVYNKVGKKIKGWNTNVRPMRGRVVLIFNEAIIVLYVTTYYCFY